MGCKEITVTTKVFIEMVSLVAASVQVQLEKAGRPKEHDIVSRHAIASVCHAFESADPGAWDQLVLYAEERLSPEATVLN